MSPVTERVPWIEANQRYLSGVVGALRARLDRHAAGDVTAGDPLDGHHHPSFDPPPALESLTAAFDLSAFERGLLAMCAATELDASFARACLEAHGTSQVTFGLALAVLPGGHWSALAPAGPLRRWRLVEVAGGDSLVSSPLRIDERVLHHLTGVLSTDDQLDGLLEALPSPDGLPASHQNVARRIAALWPGASTAPWPAVQLCGSDRPSCAAVAAAACDALGLRLLRLRAKDIPSAPGERSALARLCERELALAACALLVVVEDGAAAEEVEWRAATFAGEIGGPVLLAAPEPLSVETRATVLLDVERPGHDEQRLLWRETLGPPAERLNGHLDALVAQFDLSPAGIRAAAGALGREAGDVSSVRLWDACRVQSRRPLKGLAQRIRSSVGWDDLVLPAPQRDVLGEIALHVRNRRTVYETWGFAARSDRGLGISALFAGPSGTGKTLAAEVLANELRLDLYRIDLSQVVSKYIGETEKNLRRIFEAAEQGGAILLFDEADALFGKRSEVKDSHDRYANIEVGYLLQRMEAYRGLAILTTNMKSALDGAFLRRIRFVVAFPFPDAAQREEIWRRVFPAETPTEGLDPRGLARMSVAGGNIRNIAMNAAFLAADEGVPVRMAHIARAARGEYAKLEKALTAGELRGAP